MPDFKFAKGFFTGVLVTDVVVATGLLVLTWYVLNPREDRNRPLSRYGQYNYSEHRKHKKNKELFNAMKCAYDPVWGFTQAKFVGEE